MTARTRVLVLGGADGQLACIAAARRIDAEVILVDPRDDVPGIALADRWIALDLQETELIIQELAGLPLDAVLTDQSDYAARAASALAIELGLPGLDADIVDACSNKLIMRQRLAAAEPDLVPWFTHVFTVDEAATHLRARTGPMVVKPLLSQGSRGVAIIATVDDLPCVEDALRESGDRGVLLEAAVRGKEYSVDGFVRDGVLTPLAISFKTQYAGNPCLDERLDFLPSLFIEAEEQLVLAMHRTVKGLRIETGIVHGELIIGDRGVTVVEIALRGGGSEISGVIVPFLTGFDPAEALLRHFLGMPDLPPATDFHDRAAILRFLPVTATGRVPIPDGHIDGWLELVQSGAVTAPGSAPRSSADRAGYIITAGDTEMQARSSERDVMRALGYWKQG